MSTSLQVSKFVVAPLIVQLLSGEILDLHAILVCKRRTNETRFIGHCVNFLQLYHVVNIGECSKLLNS